MPVISLSLLWHIYYHLTVLDKMIKLLIILNFTQNKYRNQLHHFHKYWHWLFIVCVLSFQALIVVVILAWLFVPIYIKAGVNRIHKSHIEHEKHIAHTYVCIFVSVIQIWIYIFIYMPINDHLWPSLAFVAKHVAIVAP